jgi:guanidinopropionase
MQASDPEFLPISGFVLPRFAGIPTFMRLPHVPLDDARIGKVEIGLVGVPWDAGTTNRPGARHGPRALRDTSTMIRQLNQATGIQPFHLVRCADLGDVTVNPASLEDTLTRVTTFYGELVQRAITPMTVGGDHLTSLPVLRAVAAKGPLGMIHFDSHPDFYDSYFGGFKYTHGTPFRRAVEEGLLDPARVIQIGIRGSVNHPDMWKFSHDAGMRVVYMEEFTDKGWRWAAEEARRIVGSGPTYLSFDIDGLDPVFAPGTGTPEAGGITMVEAQRLVRALAGIDFIGGDVVEVSPPFDPSGLTAQNAATILFENLCVLALAAAKRKGTAAGAE